MSDDATAQSNPAALPSTPTPTAPPRPALESDAVAAAAAAAGGGPMCRLSLIGIKMGRSATQAIAASLLSSQIAATTLAAQCATAATTMTVAQAHVAAKALAVVRISVVSDARAQQVIKMISDYAATNPAALAELQALTTTNAALMSLRSNVIGSLVAAAVQESIAVAYYLATPTADAAELKAATHQVAATTAGTLAFSAGGAAVGAVLLPGAGAAIGSLIGGLGGGWLSGAAASHLTALPPDRQTGYAAAADGPCMLFAPGVREEGDYVIVMLPEAPSCHFSVAAMGPPPSQAPLQRSDDDPAAWPTTTDDDADDGAPQSSAAFRPLRSGESLEAAVGDVEVGLSELVLLFEMDA